MTMTNRILKYSLFQESLQKYICISFIYVIFSDAFNSFDHIVLNGVTISEERWKVSRKKPSHLSSCQDSMKKPQSK
jgi:hypothetical protein